MQDAEQKAHDIAARALEQGKNTIEMLVRHKLLATEQVLNDRSADTVAEIAQLIEQAPIMLFLDKGAMTFTDYKSGLVKFLRNQEQILRTGSEPQPAGKKEKKK